MSVYEGNTASDASYQHNGSVIGNQTFNYFQARNSASHPDKPDEDIIAPSPGSVRPIDARFEDDDRAVSRWLRKHNLAMVRHKRKDQAPASLIDMMSSYSVRRTFERLARRKLAGTTDWILGTTEFNNWLEGSSRELFLVGRVGSGKTTTMTTLAQKAIDVLSHEAPVLTFFFQYPMKSELDLVSSLAQQLLRHTIATAKNLPDEIRLALRQMYEEGYPKPTAREVRTDVLEPLLEMFPGCAIIIDGIDDSDLGPRSVKWLAEYFRTLNNQSPVKVLFSVRSEWELPRHAVQLAIDRFHADALSNSADIKSYIDAKLLPFSEPGELLEDPRLYSQVKQELSQKANGMFLWVSLQIEYLFAGSEAACKSPADVRTNLSQFPKGLDEIYERCILRVSSSEAEYTTRILRWICAAPEPTHIDIVRDLIAIDIIPGSFSEDAAPPRAVVRRAATNLIVSETSDSSLGNEPRDEQFLLPAHSTVRDFIFSAAGQAVLASVLQRDSGHENKSVPWTHESSLLEIGGLCAARLLTNSAQELARPQDIAPNPGLLSRSLLNGIYGRALSPSMAQMTSQAVNRFFPGSAHHHLPFKARDQDAIESRFLEYARRNWHRCLRTVSKDSKHYRNFRELVLNHADAAVHPWHQAKQVSSGSRVEALILYSLAEDHVALLDLAIETADRNKLTKTFWREPLAELRNVPILHFAVKRCGISIISRLLPLCHGRTSFQRSSALHEAVEGGSAEVAELLLAYKEGRSQPYQALANSIDSNGRIPLHLAAMYPSAAACVSLLRATKPNNLLDVGKRSPLYYGLNAGSVDVIEALTASQCIAPEDVDLKSHNGTLHLAASATNPILVQQATINLAKNGKFNIKITEIVGDQGSLDLTEELAINVLAGLALKATAEEVDVIFGWVEDDVHRLKLWWISVSTVTDPTQIRGTEGLNLIGRFVALNRLHEFQAVATLAPQSLLAVVGPWRENLVTRQVRDVPFTPLQLAAHQGIDRIVEYYIRHKIANREALWYAQVTTALQGRKVAFGLLQAELDSHLPVSAAQSLRSALGPLKATANLMLRVSAEWAILILPHPEQALVYRAFTAPDEVMSFSSGYVYIQPSPGTACCEVRIHLDIGVDSICSVPIRLDILHGSANTRGQGNQGGVHVLATDQVFSFYEDVDTRDDPVENTARFVVSEGFTSEAYESELGWNHRTWCIRFGHDPEKKTYRIVNA